MTIEDYLYQLQELSGKANQITLSNYRTEFKKIFEWVIKNGIRHTGDTLDKTGTPLWHVNYTKSKRYRVVAEHSSIKAQENALKDLKYHFFEIDLDVLIKQIEGIKITLKENIEEE